MKIFLKVFALALILAVAFFFSFKLFGDSMSSLFDQSKCVAMFSDMKPIGWALGILLLISDILLPIPATGIMAALGMVYGVWLGAVIACIGSMGAGLTGYAVSRFLGRKAGRFLASPQELQRFHALFNSWGGGAIIVSRILPILPEVVTILAGLARMHFTRFLICLTLGTVPTCLLFAYVGQASHDHPLFGLLFSILLPLVLWVVFLKTWAKKMEMAGGSPL